MTFTEYLSNNYQNLIDLSVEHLKLVLTAMLIATMAGVPLGVAAHRSAFLRPLILGVSSFFLTIPSLALFAIFIPFFGLGSPRSRSSSVVRGSATRSSAVCARSGTRARRTSSTAGPSRS